MRKLLQHEVKWHEHHLTLICIVAFGAPYLFYLASVVFIILNWNKPLGDVTLGDASAALGGPAIGTYLKRKLHFKAK